MLPTNHDETNTNNWVITGNDIIPVTCFLQALRSRDSLQLEFTDCLLDKNRLRKRIAELRAHVEQQQRELERERERSRESETSQSSSCLHCVSSVIAAR